MEKMPQNSAIKNQEAWQPLPHAAPDNFKNKLLYILRLLSDIEVSTIYRDIKGEFKHYSGKVLEIGCGFKPYKHLLPKAVAYFALDQKDSYENFQYKSQDVVYYDGGVFPFDDNAFNFIYHTEVIEHIYDLKLFLSECRRVLSPAGKLFFTFPFSARNHYIPNDFWRFTPYAIKRLLNEAGFKEIVVKARGSDLVVVISKINTLFFRLIFRRYSFNLLRLLNMLFFGTLFFIPVCFFLILAHIILFLKLGSVDDPLGYSVYCKK